jgi:hypothetical protein
MRKTVFVAVATLCLTAPSLVQAHVRGGRSFGGLGHRSAAHAMIQRHRFNERVGASRGHFHAANNPFGTTPTNQPGSLGAAAGKATAPCFPPPCGVVTGTAKPFVPPGIFKPGTASAATPRKPFLPPGIFKQHPQPPPDPVQHPAWPSNSGFPGAGAGGGQFSAGGSAAPGARYPAAPANPNPGYVAPPRYAAQPAQVTDKPVCLSGTLATQDQQQQYVCLSWFYQGRIYTPDQLEQVLAQRQ